MKLSELKLNPNNPQLFDDLSKLEKSIKEFPKMMSLRPMVVDNDNIVLGGNKRLICLQNMGYKEIPDDWVVKASELTEDEKKRFIIADNVGFGTWDVELLQSDWNTDDLEDWGLNLKWQDTKEAEEDDYEIPDEIKTDIVLGDIIEIGQHRLMCGDSTDSDQVAKLMNEEKADIVHTDPPYNIGYEGGSKKRDKIENDKLDNFNEFLYNSFINLFINIKLGGAIYIWHASTETHNFILEFLKAGFLFKSYIVWNKNNSTFGRSDYQWKHEPAIYGWKPGASHKWYGDRKQTTVWDIDRPSRSDDHPTMKPIELCKKPLQNSSKQGDIVLDLFLCSGSTMVAAHQLDRKCYGMELDPKYCQVIVDRMKKLDPTLTIKINGHGIQ